MNTSSTNRIGGYDVRTLRTAAGYRGRVIPGPRNSIDAEAGTVECSLRKIEIALVERSAIAGSGRVAGIPTAGEYLGALNQLEQRGGLGPHHGKMLAALPKVPARTLSASELARAAGWESYEAANSNLRLFAKMLALEMGYQPNETGAEGSPTWTFTLATAAPERSPEGHFRWRTQPEFAEALEGWRGSDPTA